ncbi:MAG: hypothetical protein WDW36_002918 [Sanguina aurantia]
MSEEMPVQRSATKLFLGGLSWETTEEKLRTYFQRFGEVEDVVVMKDRFTKQSRHFGFIMFKTEEAARLACLETHNIDNRIIDAKPSVPHSEGSRPRSKKIFVGGLGSETYDEQLTEYFSAFGVVSEAQVMVDHVSGRSRGFGFVTFESEEAVAKVFEAGQMHRVGGKQVEVKSATPKGSGPQAGGRGMASNYGTGMGVAGAVGLGVGGNVGAPGGGRGDYVQQGRGYQQHYGHPQQQQQQPQQQAYPPAASGMMGFTGYPPGYGQRGFRPAGPYPYGQGYQGAAGGYGGGGGGNYGGASGYGGATGGGYAVPPMGYGMVGYGAGYGGGYGGQGYAVSAPGFPQQQQQQQQQLQPQQPQLQAQQQQQQQLAAQGMEGSRSYPAYGQGLTRGVANSRMGKFWDVVDLL